MWIGDEDALSIAVDNVRRNANNRGVGWNIRQHHRSSTYARILSDCDVAENVGVISNKNSIADGWMALAMAFSRSAKGDSLVDCYIASDNGGFSDDHSGCMVDKQAVSKERAWMNIDAGIETSDLGKNARNEAQFCAPKRMRDAMKPNRPQSRIT